MNVDFSRRMFSAIDAQQFDTLHEFFTSDVVYERPGYPPIRGLPALEHFYRNVRIIDSGCHDLWHVVGDPVAAACWGRFTGRSRQGDPLDERFADVYELRDGKIALRATHFYRAAI